MQILFIASIKLFGKCVFISFVLFAIFLARSPILSKSEDIFRAATVSLRSTAIGCLKAIKFTTSFSI